MLYNWIIIAAIATALVWLNRNDRLDNFAKDEPVLCLVLSVIVVFVLAL